MIQRKNKLDDELKKELDKCSVVCSNCHRLATNRLINLAQILNEAKSQSNEDVVQTKNGIVNMVRSPPPSGGGIIEKRHNSKGW